MTGSTTENSTLDEQSVEYAQAIDDSRSFSELFAIFNEYGPIEGSSREYSAGELVSRVATIKLLIEDGYDPTPADFRRITRTYGLRYKCKELAAKYQHSSTSTPHND